MNLSNSHAVIMASRIYDEALTLLHNTRNYVQEVGPLEIFSHTVDNGIMLTTEITRITSRLAQIVSWYLNQKSYLKGDIPLDEILADENRIEMNKQLIDNSGELNPYMPSTIRDLLKNTRELYERVARLDDGFRQKNTH